MQATGPRRATSADANSVRALTRSAYEKWIAVIGREPRPMQADYERAVNEHLVDLLEEGGQLLALIEMIPRPGHLLIENIAVRPDQQSRGHGDRLLRHAEAVARSMALPEVRLYTNAAFETNLAFYARRGYRETRREAMPPGSITVYMQKRLPDAA